MTSHVRDHYYWSSGEPSFKTFDPFEEPCLFSILVLSHGRHRVTFNCITNTYKALEDYPGKIEWVFLEQGGEERLIDSNKNIEYYLQFPAKRKALIILDKNYGINVAMNDLWSLSRGEFCMIHENDWLITKQCEFLSSSLEIFRENETIGLIHLRDPEDRRENWGYGNPDYNPWSCPNLYLDGTICEQFLDNGSNYYVMKNYLAAYNHNPIILRKRIWRELGYFREPVIGSNPKEGETDYQKRFSNLNVNIAYLPLPKYIHVGGVYP